MSSYILHVVRPSDLQNWIKVNAAGSYKTKPQDSWRAYLQANGGVGGTLRDLEVTFLQAQGATGTTLRDKWLSYLTAQAGTKTKEKAKNLYK